MLSLLEDHDENRAFLPILFVIHAIVFPLHQKNGDIHFLYQVQFFTIYLFIYFFIIYLFIYLFIYLSFQPRINNSVTFSFVELLYIFLSMAKYNLLIIFFNAT